MQPGLRSNLLEHLALLAHQNCLLALALAINQRGNSRQPGSFLELFHDHAGRVGNFFFGLQQNLFANQLRRHEAHRLVGDLVFREIGRSRRHRLHHFAQQFIHSFAPERRDRHDLRELVQLAVFLDQRQQFAFVLAEKVHFIQHKKSLRAGLFEQIERVPITHIQLARRIHQQQHQVAAFQRLPHFHHHSSSQRTVGLVHPRRVDQHNLGRIAVLRFWNLQNALDAVARGLRFGRDDGQLLANQCVQQRGLAGVGPAEDANKTCAKGHGDRLLVIGCQRIANLLSLMELVARRANHATQR